MSIKSSVFFLWIIGLSLLSTAVRAQSQNDTTSIIIDSIKLSKGTAIQNVISQSSDSIDTKNKALDYFFYQDSLDVYTHNFFSDSINYIYPKYIDTLNHAAGQYNPVKYMDVAYNDLGIIGSAQNNQIFKPSMRTGFHIGIHSFDAYLWRPRDIELFDTKTPYTKLFYVMGSKKENSLKITHAQSFMDKQITASLNFQLYDHLGAYQHQHNEVKSFFGGMGYSTKDSRYQANAQYYHNKQILEENGGLANTEEFEKNQETNRQIITTNLTTGENFVRISGLSVMQKFHLSKAEPDFSQIPDTNIIKMGDYTVTHFKKPYFEPVTHLGAIKYYFNYERNNFRYTDQEQKSKIYDSIPYYLTNDSTVFFDSISMRKYQNEMIYSNSDYKDDVLHPKFLNYFFGGRHEYTQCYQDSSSVYLRHMAIVGGAFLNFSNRLSLISEVSYCIGDYSNNDLLWYAKAYFKWKGNLFSAGIKTSHRQPDWIYHQFSSSRFTWNNSLSKTDIQEIFFRYEKSQLRFFVQLSNIANYTYFNEKILPEQYSGNIQHLLVRLSDNYTIGHWGTDFHLTYQSVSNAAIIRIPDFTGRLKIYYFNNLFNNALGLELGVEGYYYTAFLANKYMPALRSYYLQNNQMIGGYPMIDVYLNAKIGKARLFVRYDHLNAGLTGNNYYASPDYPYQDASFRFGVTWLLFN